MSASVIAVKVGGQSGGAGLDQNREYVLVHQVETTDPGDGSFIVRNAAGVARPGYIYAFGNEYDLGALCRHVVPRQISKFLWEVTAHFSSKSEDPAGWIENPLLRPAIPEWDGETYLEAYERDVDGTPTLNTASDPFDPPLERERTDAILTITRNEAYYDAEKALAYADALNEDVFYGAQPGHAKMSYPRARPAYENGIGYWQVTYRIRFSRKGWDHARDSMGCKHYVWEEQAEGPPVRKKVHASENGVESTVPVHLTSSGFRMPQAELEEHGPHVLTFKPYVRLPFAPLNLGGS